MLGKHLDDVIHHFAPLIDVSIFPPAKQYRHLDFVIVFQKADGFLDLEADVMFARFRPNSDFFETCLMRFVFRLAFFLVVVKLAEVHDATNRRFRVAGNLDQIETGFLGFVQSFLRGNNP